MKKKLTSNPAQAGAQRIIPGSVRRFAAFTMIELLVVVAVIVILLGLIMPILGSIRNSRLLMQAQKEVADIKAAAQLYFVELSDYPPDTGTAEGGAFETGLVKDTVYEQDAIYNYLGRTITDEKTGKTYKPFLTLKPAYLVDQSSKQIYMDPWKKPYLMDCVHRIISTEKTGPDVGKVERVGEPYPAGTEDEKQILEVKVWSSGPDGVSELGSSAPEGKPVGKDADDICSWRSR